MHHRSTVVVGGADDSDQEEAVQRSRDYTEILGDAIIHSFVDYLLA